MHTEKVTTRTCTRTILIVIWYLQTDWLRADAQQFILTNDLCKPPGNEFSSTAGKLRDLFTSTKWLEWLCLSLDAVPHTKLWNYHKLLPSPVSLWICFYILCSHLSTLPFSIPTHLAEFLKSTKSNLNAFTQNNQSSGSRHLLSPWLPTVLYLQHLWQLMFNLHHP